MKGLKRNLFGILVLCLPILLLGAEIEVKVIKSAADLSEPFNTLWNEGDVLVSDSQNLILFGGTDRVLKSYYRYPIEHTLGSVLGYVPKGKGNKSDLVIGSPYIRIKDKRHHMGYSSFNVLPQKAQDGALQFRAVAFFKGDKGEKAEVTTLYHLNPESGKIDITSTLKNTGSMRLEDLRYSLYINSGQIYSFSPSDSNNRLPFWVYPKKGHYLGWIDLTPVRSSSSMNLDPGKSFEVQHVLLVDVEGEDLLKRIYQILDVKAAKVKIDTAGFNGELMEVVIQDMSSRYFFSSFFEKTQPFSVMLPPGDYSIRANFFPAIVEKRLTVDLEKENTCLLRAPPEGKVKILIRNKGGAFIPGKTTFFGLGATRIPYFKPENPLETNNTHEYFKNSCFPQAEGLEVVLPVGTYMISASRGPEYTLDQRVVEVQKDSLLEVDFQIDKIIETTDLISVDLHMHTLNSDGSMTIAERIKSVVAEGVDVAVATDHNYISDYPSALKKLGLGEYISVLTGQEVTPLDLNHVDMPEFNRFPLRIRDNEPGNGAIDLGFYEDNAPVIKESRKRDPGALIQANHPRRRGYGYFNYYQLDPETAATALKGFDTSFDLLEVMNGPFFSPDKSRNSQVIADWLHLLNRGYYFPITGSSDSHGIDRQEPGYARTYVFYNGAKGNGLDVEALLQAMKKGRSFVSTGPIIEFTVNDTSVPGDTVSVKESQLDVGIKVRSAPWIAVDEVRVIVNGERKIILPVKAPREQILKFQESISLNLESDSYVAIEVRGNKTLYPVVQKRLRIDGYQRGPLPYALTNPIFVDVDGNGQFDSPLPKIKLIY